MIEHPIYKGYYADTEGNIYSHKRRDITKLTPHPNQKGYMRVHIRHNNKGWLYSVGRFVLECYEGISSKEVDHINRVRYDNRLTNLRYATRSENMQNTQRGKTILVYDILEDTWETYPSVREFSTSKGLKYNSVMKAISECCIHAKRYAIAYMEP